MCPSSWCELNKEALAVVAAFPVEYLLRVGMGFQFNNLIVIYVGFPFEHLCNLRA